MTSSENQDKLQQQYELNKIYTELVLIRDTISDTELTNQLSFLNARLDFINYVLLPFLFSVIISYIIIKKCFAVFCK